MYSIQCTFDHVPFVILHVHVYACTVSCVYRTGSHEQPDLSHDRTLVPQEQSHDHPSRSHDQLSESHDHSSRSSLSTTASTEDSIDLKVVKTALDNYVSEMESKSVGDGGIAGSNKSDGIGRSVSDDVMGKKQTGVNNGKRMVY